MKKAALLFVLLCVSLMTMAQDVIVKKDGTTILSKVLEISSTEIKYKQWTNQDGPLYSINRSEVISINYQNGSVEQFSNVSAPTGNTNTTNNTNTSPASTNPDLRNGIMERDGRDLELNGRELSDEEVRALVGEENYKTYESARKQVNLGRGFTMAFGLSLGMCAIFMVTAVVCGAFGDYYTAYTYYILGACMGGLASVSLPLMCVFKGIGKGRLNWIANEYNNSQKSKAFSYQLSPSILQSRVSAQQTNAAFGLTLRMNF